MVQQLRAVPGNARRKWDRLLHPLRRNAARKSLLQHDGTSILVLCQGNLCRSPFAEAVLQAALPAGTEVRSAGFSVPGRSAPPDAISAARRWGYDLSRHSSRLVTAGLVRAASLIVVMEPEQARELADRFGVPAGQVLVLGDLDPDPIDIRSVTDPMLKPRDVFIDAYDRIERCAAVLGRLLRRAAARQPAQRVEAGPTSLLRESPPEFAS
jgi:protein-tyrosine phosphatase